MPKETQISALISEPTRDLLEKHVRATGVKKGHLVEQALLHHLQALEELPAELIVHPRIVVSRKTGQAILEQMESAEPPPTDARWRLGRFARTTIDPRSSRTTGRSTASSKGTVRRRGADLQKRTNDRRGASERRRGVTDTKTGSCPDTRAPVRCR